MSLFRQICGGCKRTTLMGQLPKVCYSTEFINALMSAPLFDQSKENCLDQCVKPVVGRMPSVTHILDKTKSEESEAALKAWERKMIKQMGFNAFLKYKRDMMIGGNQIHRIIAEYVSAQKTPQFTESSEYKPMVHDYWRSISTEIHHFSSPLAVEKKLINSRLQYTGILDCAATYRSQRFIIDWKTKTDSTRRVTLFSAYDAPIQVAAYVGMWNLIMPSEQIENGMLVYLYSDGSPCSVISLDKERLAIYWTMWLDRLHTYWLTMADVPLY